jgi:hypothetical protein
LSEVLEEGNLFAGLLLQGEEFERSQPITGFKKMISDLFGKS